ncbi:YfbM family protein [Prosthecobacter vanneervenii]|nr:YfbM family protein [Prosthecobacter vanneervenii]
MCGSYLRVTNDQLEQVLNEPDLILDMLFPEDDTEFEAGRYLDIDKSWQIIHFLLTGDALDGDEPLCNAVMGGTEIGDVEVVYGPARFLLPEQVVEVATALTSISEDELWNRFDIEAARKAEIYPQGWTGSETDRSYVLNHFKCLKTYFVDAANAQEPVILYLS